MNAQALAKKYSGLSLGIGAAGIIIALVGVFMGVGDHDPRNLISYLIGMAFWLSVLIGMLFLVMIWYTFDAGWPIIIRRQIEHALSGFKWLFLLFIPLAIIPLTGADNAILWKWMNPDHVMPNGETVANDVLYTAKEAYLNIPFFMVRVVLIFGLWILFAEAFRYFSSKQDEDGNGIWTSRSRRLAGPGLFFIAIGTTLAAIDWFKSLEFHWFSTMYGVWYFAASMRAALAVTVLITIYLGYKGYLKGLINQSHKYLLGCLCLAFTVFWAYISFSQYFLIYMANIPEETFWYNIREKNPDGGLNSWWWVSMGLVFGHFFAPFLSLLFYNTKVRTPALVAAASWILVFCLLDIFWNILPGKLTDTDPASLVGYQVRQFSITPFDLAAIVGVGGIVAWAFFSSMKKHEIIPIRDPHVLESINYSE